MKKYLAIMMGMVGVFAVSGCSTIIHGTRQRVVVNTEPAGAEVLLDGQQQVTPTVFNVKGSSGYSVVANKKGYRTAHGYVDGQFRVGSTIFGNILWLIPGLLVDFVTGSAYEMQSHTTIPMVKAEK